MSILEDQCEIIDEDEFDEYNDDYNSSNFCESEDDNEENLYNEDQNERCEAEDDEINIEEENNQLESYENISYLSKELNEIRKYFNYFFSQSWFKTLLNIILRKNIEQEIRRLITLVISSNIVYLHSLKVIHKLELNAGNFIKDFKVR